MNEKTRKTVIQVRVNENERAALQVMAQDNGICISEQIRALIREEAVRRGLPLGRWLDIDTKTE